MAATIHQLIAKKNTAFTCYTGLISSSSPSGFFVTSFAAGDVAVSKDGGNFNNITNSPTPQPPGGGPIQVILTASEMNADWVVVRFVDISGGGRYDQNLLIIQTYDRLFNELLYPTYQVPDSVSSDGARPTIEQAIYMLTQVFSDRAVVGSTVTVFKPDGVTALMTFTLNSPTNPTAITRSA